MNNIKIESTTLKWFYYLILPNIKGSNHNNSPQYLQEGRSWRILPSSFYEVRIKDMWNKNLDEYIS